MWVHWDPLDSVDGYQVIAKLPNEPCVNNHMVKQLGTLDPTDGELS